MNAGLLLFTVAALMDTVSAPLPQQAMRPGGIARQGFALLDEQGKLEALKRLATTIDVGADSDDVRLPLSAGLRDMSAEVRRASLKAIARRTSILSAHSIETYRSERTLLSGLRPLMNRLIDDPDAAVRRDVIDTIAGLEEDLTRPAETRKVLRKPFGDLLAARYKIEPNGLVRYRIINVFGWFRAEPQLQADAYLVISQALVDPDDGVTQAAIEAIARQRIESLLPELGRFISHVSVGIRASAAAAIGDFGSSAKQYVSLLESALRSEQDPIVRSNLQSALKKVR